MIEERWLSAMAALDELTFLADWADVCEREDWVEHLADLMEIPPRRPVFYEAEVPWYDILLTWGDVVTWIRDQHWG